MASEWDFQSPGRVVLGMGDFNEHVGKRIDVCEGVHGGYEIGKKNVEERRLLEFCDEKEVAWQKHGLQRRSQEK